MKKIRKLNILTKKERDDYAIILRKKEIIVPIFINSEEFKWEDVGRVIEHGLVILEKKYKLKYNKDYHEMDEILCRECQKKLGCGHYFKVS